LTRFSPHHPDRGRSRIVPTFAESLSRKAHARLTQMGVEIRTNARVETVDAAVGGRGRAHREPYRLLDGRRHAVTGRQWLQAETDRAGRVRVP
jgi:NADH dehydrogenase